MSCSDYLQHYKADAEGKSYFKPWDSPGRQIEIRRAQLLVRLLDKRCLSPGAKIADIGVGGGELIRQLPAGGPLRVGLDIPVLNLTETRATLEGKGVQSAAFVCGDAYKLPFQSGSLDAAILSEIVEHLEKPGAAFAEAARALKPGGQLLVSCPYKETISYQLCVHCNQLTPTHAHLHKIDEAFIREAIAGLPFTVEREVYFNNILMRLAQAPMRMRKMPYAIWRTADRMANAALFRPYYYGIVLRKT